MVHLVQQVHLEAFVFQIKGWPKVKLRCNFIQKNTVGPTLIAIWIGSRGTAIAIGNGFPDAGVCIVRAKVREFSKFIWNFNFTFVVAQQNGVRHKVEEFAQKSG